VINKEEVRQYWRRKERETFLKVFCLSLIGTAILIVGCGETEEEINANNAKSRAAVEAASANNNIKSTGSVIAKKVGGSATIILPDNQKLQLVTWKNDNMWVLYRPMRADEQAETYTYQEDSKFGLIEAKITIREVKR
jgi:hypothetical protein